MLTVYCPRSLSRRNPSARNAASIAIGGGSKRA